VPRKGGGKRIEGPVYAIGRVMGPSTRGKRSLKSRDWSTKRGGGGGGVFRGKRAAQSKFGEIFPSFLGGPYLPIPGNQTKGSKTITTEGTGKKKKLWSIEKTRTTLLRDKGKKLNYRKGKVCQKRKKKKKQWGSVSCLGGRLPTPDLTRLFRRPRGREVSALSCICATRKRKGNRESNCS